MFFLQLAVVGSTMGTRDELEQLARFLETSGVRPVIDRELPLADARDGFAAMAAGSMVARRRVRRPRGLTALRAAARSATMTSQADGPAGRRPLGYE